METLIEGVETDEEEDVATENAIIDIEEGEEGEEDKLDLPDSARAVPRTSISRCSWRWSKRITSAARAKKLRPAIAICETVTLRHLKADAVDMEDFTRVLKIIDEMDHIETKLRHSLRQSHPMRV